MSTTYWNDLDKLTEITDSFDVSKVDFKPYEEDFKESMLYFIDDFLKNNITILKDPYFNKILYGHLYDVICELYKNQTQDYDIIDTVITESIEYYFSYNTPRSYPTTFTITRPNLETIQKKIKGYESMEQPDQQTPEWYNFRWTCLTASSIWKALDSDSNKNQLILSKCVPINSKKYDSVNISSPMHNGHRFEPLSTLWYENRYNTTIGEFGCIRHPTILFLGASPDGINIDPKNDRYGRALEIKNPVNRELTGIPKKDYWIQMQMQMEVWDLDECDFLETCFKCYDNEETFYKDGDFNKTKDDKLKGIIIQFFANGKPVYKYPPINCNKNEFEKWYDKIFDENIELTWTQNIYWWLDSWSCVLVPRNRAWFKAVLPDFKKIWDIILKERVNGYDHRKPRKRKKKPIPIINMTEVNENMKILFAELPDTPKVVNNTPIVKIRTESFDKLNQANEHQ